MFLLETTIRQEGWHEYKYYFDMGYDNSILFPNIHSSHDRSFSQSQNKAGTAYFSLNSSFSTPQFLPPNPAISRAHFPSRIS
jgi:hypothetical protein